MNNDTKSHLAVLSGIDNDTRPKAMNGTVAVVPSKSSVSPEELERAENELRQRAKQLFKNIEQNYWDLGQCLYDVYDGVPGGYRSLLSGDGSRSARKALFEKWGFKSFQEYAEKDVGILKRSAENMRYAYYWFEIRLNIPKAVKEQVKALGRSKCYVLAGFVTEDNVETWIEKAKVMTHEDLKKAVKATKATQSDADACAEGSEFPLSDDAGIGRDGDSEESSAPPKPEEMHQFHTSLYEGQWETVQAALDRAKGMSHSDKIGHNLEMICTDFLSNNEFGKDKDVDLKQYIRKMELLLGVKLIAVDLKAGKPLYGADFLWKLVQERLEHEKSSPDEVDNVTPITSTKGRPDEE